MSGPFTPRPSASKSAPDTINNGSGLQSPSGTNENLLSPLKSNEGLRRSIRTNILSADGISTADEDMTSKAMRRAAIRNLDSPPEKKFAAAHSVLPHSPSSPLISQPGTHNSCSAISFNPIPDTSCVTNLNNLGFKIGNSSAECTLSIKALKKIEVDRTTVTSHTKHLKKGDMDAGGNKLMVPDASDDEAAIDDDLLAHLIKDVSEVDFENIAPDTKLSDLKATARKSKSTSRKRKTHKRAINKT